MASVPIEIIQGDITKVNVDAVVNAANSSLLGGGGVDGAIHRAAGPDLLEESRKLGGCATGWAKLTKGYRLPAKWIIHAVGPMWQGGEDREEELLGNCYRACFALARTHGIRSIAFPAISTGAYRFPLDRATRIALTECRKFLETNKTVEKIVFVCFDPKTLEVYQNIYKEIFA